LPHRIGEVALSDDDERAYLEGVLSGKVPPNVRIPAAMGRLAELYLAAQSEPDKPEKALALARAALKAVGAEDPLYPKLRHQEAMALRLVKTTLDPDLASDGLAANIDREAWKIGYEGSSVEAVLYAQQWGDWAWQRGRYDQAGEAYSKANKALERHLLRHVLDDWERRKFLKFQKLATRGCYALAMSGQAKDAIVLLERASSLFGQMGRDWRLIERLRQQYPELAARLSDAQKEVYRISQQLGIDRYANISNAEHEAQASLDATLNEVRKMPAFASLGAPVSWADVAAAAAIKPLVYLVPTDRGCMILVVVKKAENNFAIAPIPLDITWSDVHAASIDFLEAAFGDVRSDPKPRLATLLEWLGAHVMIHVQRVFSEIGHINKPFAITPFGIFTILPLHATFLTLEDRLWYLFRPGDISYSYSVRALVDSHRDGQPATTQDSLQALIIDNPVPLGAPFEPLLLSGFEVAAVKRRFPAATVISGTAATSSRVKDALPGADLLHFCCHGSVDRTRDYSGILLLAHRQILTFDEIRERPNLRAKLVGLFACRSGTVALAIEQPQSLPAAFLSAGAKAVIGTLWDADEIASLLLASKFYELWDGGRTNPAEALGAAQTWLMTANASALRSAVDPEVLASPAAVMLADAAPGQTPFFDPWYWAGFFAAGP
jgi:tetratricopeptide (TPR) repeat protein